MTGIADSLKQAGANDIALSVGSRVDTLDKEKLEILKHMNVYKISFGIETGSERIMREIDKNINLNDVVPTIKMVNDAGIATNTYFIFNHPGETLTDMQATILLIKELNKNCRLNTVELNIGFPYPATPWWNYCESKSLSSDIDFYRHSHKYNHQQIPDVNMTKEPLSTIIELKNLVERMELRHNTLVRARKAVKVIMRDPKSALQRIIR